MHVFVSVSTLKSLTASGAVKTLVSIFAKEEQVPVGAFSLAFLLTTTWNFDFVLATDSLPLVVHSMLQTVFISLWL